MKSEKISVKLRLKQFRTILVKDIKSEVRQLSDLLSVILFNIISIFIFSSVYNFGTQYQNMPLEIFVIQNWLIIFFTLIYIMAKLFIKEKESGTIGGLTSSPISPNLILFSKTIYCLILLISIESILYLFSFFLSAPLVGNINSLQVLTYIILGIVLPSFDLSICGSLVSALSMYAKNKSFVLPILLFPLIIPITTPIVSLNIKLLEGVLISALIYEIGFLFAHIILMISLLTLISHILLYD
ncbi:MAG: heme exporter protein CcmB [Promethearchaeota archaeon]